MRKLGIILLVLASVLLLVGPQAMAAVQGTSHQTNAGLQGVCSACHIPHGGTAGATSRLWPVAPTTNLVPGVTGSLCASCHFSTGAYRATMADAFSDAYVYGTYSHGNQMTIAEVPQGSSLTSSGLPYTGDASQTPATGGVIECTSCHDVHNDPVARRPFLRDDIDVLCARCHSLRNYVMNADSTGATAAVGNWDNVNNVGVNNPGSHPVGLDIAGDQTGNSPISWPNESMLLKNTAINTWSLGGHRRAGNTGGVMCNTCHAVHGIQRDNLDTTSPAVTATAPTGNMLIIAQATTGNEGESAPAGRSVNNGDGDPNNALCEGCHRGPTPTGPGGVAYSGTRYPNPGNTAYTHPVDDLASANEAVTAFPTNWPASSTLSIGGNRAAICESCHTPHPAANDTNRASIALAADGDGEFILRAGTGDVCALCHSGRVTRHHPVGQSIASAIGGSGPASYLRNGTAAGLSTTLSCSTCHLGAGGMAHNWTTPGGLAINPNWRPANNGRSEVMATDRYAASPNPVTTENVSATCIDCHLGLDGNTTNASPTVHATGRGVNATDNTEYQILGEGTHYVGPFASAFFAAARTIRSQTGQTINPLSDAWTATRFGAGNANGGWSRFGGTSAAPILVCESCHELDPTYNVGSHMLLSSFYEGQSSLGTSSGGVQYDDFCEACHGVPTGTHAMFNQAIGRTGTTLSTTINTVTRPWLAGAAPVAAPTGGAAGTSTWLTGGAGVGVMTCDSCHQVHDAETQSASLIIEGPDLNVTGGTPINVTSANYYGGTNYISRRLRQQTASNGDTTAAAMPDVSIFCDQCHTYRAQ